MIHKSVLLNQVIDYFEPEKNENFIDATLGLGGHSQEILKLTGPKGRLLGIDWDEKALIQAKQNLAKFSDRVIFEKGNYRDLVKFAKKYNLLECKGILLDLGLGSWQLDQEGYGFSFNSQSDLDMRYISNGQSAKDIINKFTQKEIANILYQYADETKSRKIAEAIVAQREKSKFETVGDLVKTIEQVIPRTGRIHPATKTLMALRIYVNSEYTNLEQTLIEAIDHFNGSILAVISFHSGEDRIVKNIFKDNQDKLQIITKKPIVPELKEIKNNPRARSAKLRIGRIIKEEGK